MNRRVLIGLLVGLAAAGVGGLAWAEPRERAARQTLFIGLDTSGSFQRAGYDDALSFLALYIHGHLEGLGGLQRPRDLFVAAVGGRQTDEPKAFRPLHDFVGKSAAQIEADLRVWFPPTDTLTDFNAFFRRVAQITKERNLLLRPVTILIVTDGVPDPAPGVEAGSPAAYRAIDLAPLEYLARRVTLRLAYPSPPVAERWRTLVPRQRVRLWTVDDVVMKGWRAQLLPDADPAGQERLWKWVRENVDFRARRGT
ncbi:MAG TPA: hypothetical protein VNO23_03120 [Candidatus Binatia bacterium]|nr:hypothetical protein [Candidatus Binatia bacterium]